MTGYLLRRAGQGVLVLWAAYTVTFVVLFVLPGDPIALMLNPGGQAQYVDPEQEAALRAEYGFDKPPLEQYLDRIGSALQADLGRSVQSGAPVTTVITEALPETLKLAGLGLLLAVVLGGGVAILATYLRSSWLRGVLLALPPLGLAMPTFWVGMMLLQIFSFRLGWFPAFGNVGLMSLVMPAATLAVPTGAVIAQVLASSLLSTWRQPFVDTAVAKGASRLRVHLHHVLRTSIGPALSILGLIVGSTFAGAVVIEVVFSRLGVGRVMQTAVTARDIPLIQGLVVMTAVVFVVVNLVVDLLYPLLDPRVVTRSGRAARA